MDLFALTKSTTFIIGPIASLLGYLMEGIYWFCGLFNVENIGLYIILFTIVVNIILLPLTIKQQKSMKINAVIQPEIQALQSKYKDKRNDQQAMQQQQAEMSAIYQKYGTSPTSGCLPMLVQMPILFALYKIIYNIPAYVSGIYRVFQNAAEPIMGQSGYMDKINAFIDENNIAVKVTEGNMDSVVDFLYKLSSDQWQGLKESFPTLVSQIQETAEHVINMNSFFGINLMDAPGLKLTPALIIPILAGLSQWVSVRILQSGQPKPAADDRTAGSMKMMNNIMPLMSVVFCISLPACVGIYWVASSVVRTIIQAIVNQFLKGADIDSMIAKNVAKREKKLARAGVSQINEKANTNTRSSVYRNSNIDTSNINTNYSSSVRKENKTDTGVNEKASGLFGKKNSNPAPSKSISEKARMVNNYNDKNHK